MKHLSNIVRTLVAGVILSPTAAWAGSWPSCQTITALTDFTSYNYSIYLNLSPGVTGCSTDVIGGLVLRVGAAGVTADQYKMLYTTSILAYSLRKSVLPYYDNSSAPSCFSSVVSIGGYSNQCN